MKTLRGKVTVVTGGASGIGFALAQRFLREGANVVIADIDQESLDRQVPLLRETAVEDADVIGVRTDVSSIESLEALATATIDRFGRVDVLCNNAGVETGGTIEEISERAWRWVMDVNFFGVLNGCRTFLPLLRRQEEAHIVNTASVAAFASGTPTMAPYCASKFAVLGFSESLEIEMRSSGAPVGVSVLAPGPVKTRMTEAERNRPDDVPAASGDARRRQMENLNRITQESGLEPDRVADMVADAVLSNTFFVLPHAEIAVQGVRTRIHWMETGEPPAPRQAGT